VLTAVGEPAATAQEVTPLAVGDSLPELTLKTAEGEAFDLNAAVAKKPTILILYRGGW
jgi:peroxiredoxin